MLNRNKWLVSVCVIIITLLCCANTLASTEKPISFMQYDNEWGSQLYSITNNTSQTIATSGCGPTSMAMVLNYYIDSEITPLQTVKYALENNYRTYNNGTSWAYFSDIAKKYGLEFLQTASSSEALKWMETKNDPLIICSMGPGLWTRNGHFILLWNVENGLAYINDPASTNQERIQNSYDYMSSQCRQYFCFNIQQVEEICLESAIRYSLREKFTFTDLILQGGEEAISPLNKLENAGVSPAPTQFNNYWCEDITTLSISLGN